ncbi:serine/threonine-protein kinase [Streptomyces sp. B15]|uniref:serine/threonine-protein kinase n=1 Tax=Streptomyces sp. B15 TaxID=1537797 RepID=UPI001B38D48A|nr:serine/threonine-protein kinase [Streptomyces sp. B15]MBQ1123466.1 ABC transporter substrate-binding protein [Streptomyces sp. B15]
MILRNEVTSHHLESAFIGERPSVWDLAPSDPRMVGSYRTRAVLGEGGMGRVLLASDSVGGLVAVKLVRDVFAAYDSTFRQRLRREGVAAQRVRSRRTARVVDVDADAGVPWLAYEFHQGPTLQRALAVTSALPESGVLRLAAGLATALRDIHAARFIHRDVSTANVLLGDDGPVVIDFGIARSVAPEAGASDQTQLVTVTRTGMVIGNPGFMSPEQAMGMSDLTPASDIFSLGTLLATAATGRNPFQGTSSEQVRFNVMMASADLEQVPAALRQVIEPCLARDPARRPDAQTLLTTIGTPTLTPPLWPEAVHTLIRQQHAELDRYTEIEPATVLPGPHDLDPTKLFTTGTEPSTSLDPSRADAPATPGVTRRTGLRLLAAGVAAAGAAAAAVAVPWSFGDDSEAAGEKPAEAAAGAFPVRIKHNYGETVVRSRPQRVAAWGWGTAEVAIALGTFPVGIAEEEAESGRGILPWVAQAYEDEDLDAPVLFSKSGSASWAFPEEQIAATKPDLILAPYSGLTEEQYKKLSAIAPVVARPAGASVEPWEGVIATTAKALGVAAKGKELLAKSDARLAELGQQHGLPGLSFAAVVNDPPRNRVHVFSDASPVVRVLEGLGLRLAAAVPELDTDDDGMMYALDYEDLDGLESDVIILYSTTSELAERDLANEELNALPAFAAGRVARLFGTDEFASAASPTVLSIRWAGGMPVLAESLEKAEAVAH